MIQLLLEFVKKAEKYMINSVENLDNNVGRRWFLGNASEITLLHK
jgi:hypothetical protein